MAFNNPMNEKTIECLVDEMCIQPEDCFLEIGCGEGALLELVAKKYSCNGIGVDIDATAIEKARLKLKALHSKITVICEPANKEKLGVAKFHHVACLGSSGAFGKGTDAYLATLSATNELLVKNGKLLIGELFWKCSPPAEYLEKTGIQDNDMFLFPELLNKAEAKGFGVYSAIRASEQDWDIFESSHLRKRISAGKAETAKSWFNSYATWGKDCMGFALLLLHKR